MFCDSNYVTNKETSKSVSGLVATLRRRTITCSSKTQRNITFISMDAKYIEVLACAQEENFSTFYWKKCLKSRYW